MPGRLLLVGADAQARATLAATIVDEPTAVGRLHAGAKAMGPETALAMRLIGALHVNSPAADATPPSPSHARVLCDATRGRGEPQETIGMSGFSNAA